MLSKNKQLKVNEGRIYIRPLWHAQNMRASMGKNENLSVKCNSFSNFQSSIEFNYGWYNRGEIREQGGSLGQPNASASGNTFGHSGSRIDIANHPSNLFKYNHNGTPPNVINVIVQQVNNIANCATPALMVLANFDPEAARTIIDAEQNDELRELYFRQLSEWYDNHDREYERLQLLLSENSREADEQLFPIYLEKEQYIEALDILNARFGFTDQESIDYYTVGFMQLNWAANELSPLEMTGSEKAALSEIVERRTRASGTALALLNYLTVTDITLEEETDTTAERKANVQNISDNEKNFGMLVSPNPAVEFIKIDYNFPEEGHDLILSDEHGRKIMYIRLSDSRGNTNIPLKNLSTGIYFLEHYFEDNFIDKQKIIINYY